MAGPVQNKAIGGVTPLGIITITAGTPQQITKNMTLSDKVYTLTCRQLGFSIDASPAGEVYVNYGNFAGKDTNATLMILQSGTVESLPAGSSATEGCIDAARIWLDGSASCVVAIYALDASS